MTKTEIMDKIKEFIKSENKWLSMYYKGKEIGAIKMNDQSEQTKKEILECVELRKERNDAWSLWIEKKFGNGLFLFDVWFSFDECRVEGY